VEDSLRILLVDDSATARAQLAQLLTELGHEPQAMASAREAAEAVSSGEIAPDVVICDLVMPDMDGLELLAEMRRHDQDTPFILVTAYASLESAVEALRLGADDYLHRPVERHILAHRLATVLDRRALAQAREKAQKLEAALATAGAAAHELNQPLAAIMASAELIGVQDDAVRIKTLAGLVQEQAKRLGKVTHRLTNLVRYETMPYVGDDHIVDLEASSRPDDEP